MQILEIITQCKFISAMCHAHKSRITVALTVLMKEKQMQLCKYLSIDLKQSFPRSLPSRKGMTSEPDNNKCVYACVCVNSCMPNCAAKRKRLRSARLIEEEDIVHFCHFVNSKLLKNNGWVAGGDLLALCITPISSWMQCIHISEKKRRKIVHPVLKSTKRQ